MATPTTLPASYVAGTVLTAASLNNLRGAFRVLQVVQTLKTDVFTTTSTSLVDVTGMSVTITPSATSNRILVLLSANVGAAAGAANVVLLRGSTAICVGDAASLRPRTTMSMRDTNTPGASAIAFLDSPSTTSATTYKIQMSTNSGGTAILNRLALDTDGAFTDGRSASTITVFEISA